MAIRRIIGLPKLLAQVSVGFGRALFRNNQPPPGFHCQGFSRSLRKSVDSLLRIASRLLPIPNLEGQNSRDKSPAQRLKWLRRNEEGSGARIAFSPSVPVPAKLTACFPPPSAGTPLHGANP